MNKQETKIERITYKDDKQLILDEVLVKNPESVFIERMDDGQIFISIEQRNNKRITISYWTQRNGLIFGNHEIGG